MTATTPPAGPGDSRRPRMISVPSRKPLDAPIQHPEVIEVLLKGAPPQVAAIRINEMKKSGVLRRRDSDRALAEQLQHEVKR